jgi:hypothetical protein
MVDPTPSLLKVGIFIFNLFWKNIRLFQNLAKLTYHSHDSWW